MRHFATRLALAVFALPATLCFGATHKVAESRIECGSWVMQGVYAAESPGVFDNVVAIAKPGSVQNGNIVALWYSKQPEGWVTKSWATDDPRQAVKFIKEALSIPDSEDPKWLTPPVGVTSQPAQDYQSGVLVDDPMLDVIETSPDPEYLLNVLVASGYKAAAIGIDDETTCSVGSKMDLISSEFSRMYAGGDETVLSLATFADFCMAGAPIGPAPTQPTKPTTAPGWSPPGTVPTAPAWTPGGWPTNPGPPVTPKWWCFSTAGGASCFCSRKQRWGRWETTTCGFIITWTCIRWHEIIETESCNMNLAPSCPAGGPPPPGAVCDSTY